jgi:hypothetical protein
MTLVALISIALDILAALSLRIQLLRIFGRSIGIAVTHGFMVIFWLAVLISGLSPLNVLDLYLPDGTNSTSALVAIVL